MRACAPSWGWPCIGHRAALIATVSQPGIHRGRLPSFLQSAPRSSPSSCPKPPALPTGFVVQSPARHRPGFPRREQCARAQSLVELNQGNVHSANLVRGWRALAPGTEPEARPTTYRCSTQGKAVLVLLDAPRPPRQPAAAGRPAFREGQNARRCAADAIWTSAVVRMAPGAS